MGIKGKDIDEVIIKSFKKFTEFLRAHTIKEYQSKKYYSDVLIMWLMICQRLHHACSMADILELLKKEKYKNLIGDCKRKEDGHFPKNTGGYSRARQKLKLEKVVELIDELTNWILQTISVNEQIYAIDGTTIELKRTRELMKKYPPIPKGHYPIMRVLTCHEVNTGIAIRPEYGAVWGSKVSGEIELSKGLIPRILRGATLMGDRNFGISSVVVQAHKQGLNVVLRVKEDRALRLYGKKKLPKNMDQKVIWTPSKNELTVHPELKETDQVQGRLICKEIKDPHTNSKFILILFTTTTISKNKVIKLYCKRWSIESDLRDIKKTTNMDSLHVNSEDTALKELYLGFCAYILTRMIIKETTQRLKLEPRSVSFSRMFTAVSLQMIELMKHPNRKKQKEIVESLLESTIASKLPKRKKKRIEPRGVVRNKFSKYPTLLEKRDENSF